MTDVVKSVILFALLAGLAMSATAKPVYKWVDENGVVNYSSELPPAGSRSKLVASANSNVSSYDPVQAGLDASAQQHHNTDYLRSQNDRLQRELDDSRYARQRSADAAEAARKRRMEECQRQRRVDCDSYYDDYAYPPVYAVARYPLPLVGLVPVSAPRAPRLRAAGFRLPR
jgi:hypothetical protein